jgi:hypothetical protein
VNNVWKTFYRQFEQHQEHAYSKKSDGNIVEHPSDLKILKITAIIKFLWFEVIQLIYKTTKSEGVTVNGNDQALANILFLVVIQELTAVGSSDKITDETAEMVKNTIRIPIAFSPHLWPQQMNIGQQQAYTPQSKENVHLVFRSTFHPR